MLRASRRHKLAGVLLTGGTYMTNIDELNRLLWSLDLSSVLSRFGLLDEVISMENEILSDDYISMYYDAMCFAADYIYSDYIEDYGFDKCYFSNKSMTEYYKLCHQYGRTHRVKMKDNPYTKEAKSFVNSAMNLACNGYGWKLKTKVNNEFASGIVVVTDDYFDGQNDLLEAMLEIRQWYTDAVIRLRGKLMEEGVITLPALPAAKEAERI